MKIYHPVVEFVLEHKWLTIWLAQLLVDCGLTRCRVLS